MPLNRPDNYDGRFLPYEVKRALVENKCRGCGYFVEVTNQDDPEVVMLGCIYENDLKGINVNIREDYLTVTEIAHNTCIFWFGQEELVPDEPDSRPEGVTEYT